jgi:3-oxoacyl-(acyl-carrier-protein) synthase
MDFEGINRGEQSVFKRGLRGVQPKLIFSTHVASIASTIVDVLKISAKAMAVQSSCCGGADAIGLAAEAVASGEVDLAICGGTECPLYKHPLLELRGAGLTPPTADRATEISRPFDLWRTTGVVSEGACMVVLEPEGSPRPGISWVRGFAYAHDEAGKLCSGLVTAIHQTLANAGLHPEEIEVISAWGPGHRIIDAAEAKALAEVFGARVATIPAVSIKGALGNPLAAAPAIQIGCAALAQRYGRLPPTVNWMRPDPACRLGLSATVRAIPHDFTLVDAHGLSGMNSCLVLERCK